MNTASIYDRAAPTWGKKVSRLGYAGAYGAFLANSTRADGPVLDVGTGNGLFARSWVDAGGSPDLTLLDLSAAMLERARDQFIQRSLTPTLENCVFDEFRPAQKYSAILGAHVLEHCADPFASLCRMAQTLSEGGRLYLVISKPHWCNWIIWLRFRHRWFRPEKVCDMARRAGLMHVKTHMFNTGPPSRTSLGYIFAKS